MGGNTFNPNEGNKGMNDEDKKNEQGSEQTPASTPAPAEGDKPASDAPSKEESSVETGDATQGGEPAAASETASTAGGEGDKAPAEDKPAEPTEDKPAEPAGDKPEEKTGQNTGEAVQHETVSGMKVRVTGAIKGETVLDGSTTIGDALKAMGHSAPSNFTLRDEVTSNVVKLTDPISSLGKGATISAAGKGASAQTTSAQSSGGVTATRRAAGG